MKNLLNLLFSYERFIWNVLHRSFKVSNDERLYASGVDIKSNCQQENLI